MPLNQMPEFTFKHSNQIDPLYTQYTGPQIKGMFDSRGDELRTALNNLIIALNAATGASNIGATAPSGLTGSTIQDLINSLLSYIQTNYYNKTDFQSLTQGSSGGSKINVPQLTPTSGTTVESQLAYLLQQIGSTALGSIPDGSVTLLKLATDATNKINSSLNQIGAVTDVNGNITNLNTPNKTNIVNGINSHLAESPTKTTSNITYYVDAINGLDTNDGLSSGVGHAFKTIMKAISMIPQVVNHTININVALGTYNEDITINGFVGSGTLTLNGDTVVSDNYNVKSITLNNCSCYINIVGFKITGTGNKITINGCTHLLINYCKFDNNTSGVGVTTYFSLVIIRNSLIANQNQGISAWSVSTILSSNNTGNGNTTALYSVWGSTIGKDGAQPSGTTAESSNTGGVIR